jgi:hypothetical protein
MREDPAMSRRRTTQKLHASLKEDLPVSTEAQAVAPEADQPGDSVVPQHENPMEGALGPWLAAEAARRAASEERTADTLGRYFKATVAILCLNMVVGGANVAVSFMNAGEPRTVVVTQPAPTTGSQLAPSLSGTVPAAADPSPQASAPPSPTPPAATPPPSPAPLLGKVPLLGKPGKPPAATRPARAVTTTPVRIRPPTATDEAGEDEPEIEPSRLAAERW